jgi:hypothetical protein
MSGDSAGLCCGFSFFGSLRVCGGVKNNQRFCGLIHSRIRIPFASLSSSLLFTSLLPLLSEQKAMATLMNHVLLLNLCGWGERLRHRRAKLQQRHAMREAKAAGWT